MLFVNNNYFCVWVADKTCDEDNETTGEQRKMWFLQAKGLRCHREDGTPKLALRENLIQRMVKKKKKKRERETEDIPDKKNWVKAKSLPRAEAY